MKCKTCSLDAFAIRATEETPYRVRRTYRCANKHEHQTLEVLPAGVSKRDLAAAERQADRAAATWERNQAILRDLSSMSAEALGAKWHLTGARIRQIRDTVRVIEPQPLIPTVSPNRGPQDEPDH